MVKKKQVGGLWQVDAWTRGNNREADREISEPMFVAGVSMLSIALD